MRIVAGMTSAIFHARNSLAPHILTNSNRTGMIMNVNPPPRLPQPPTKALAEPTIFTLNIADVQNWQGINDPPSIPTQRRTMIRSVPFLIKPENAKGMEPTISRLDITRLGPNLSHNGPANIRTAIVAEILAIPDRAISVFERPNSFIIVGISG